MLGEFIDYFYWLSVDVNVHVRCCLIGGRLHLSLFDTDLYSEVFVGLVIHVVRSLGVNDSLVRSCIVRQYTKILARELYYLYEKEVDRICTGCQCQYGQEVLGSV